MTEISESHLYRYIAEASEPTASRLAAIASAGKVSLDWLITGVKVGSDQTKDEKVLDPRLLEQILVQVQVQGRTLGVDMAPHRLAHITGVIYRLALKYDGEMVSDDEMIQQLIHLIGLGT